MSVLVEIDEYRFIRAGYRTYALHMINHALLEIQDPYVALLVSEIAEGKHETHDEAGDMIEQVMVWLKEADTIGPGEAIQALAVIPDATIYGSAVYY